MEMRKRLIYLSVFSVLSSVSAFAIEKLEITRKQFDLLTKEYPLIRPQIFQKSQCPSTFQVVKSSEFPQLYVGLCPELLKKISLDAKTIIRKLDEAAEKSRSEYHPPEEADYTFQATRQSEYTFKEEVVQTRKQAITNRHSNKVVAPSNSKNAPQKSLSESTGAE